MNFIHLDNWVSRINAGQFDELVSMYSEDAVLFATFDKQPLINPDLIQGYFRGFLARKVPALSWIILLFVIPSLGMVLMYPLDFTPFSTRRMVNP